MKIIVLSLPVRPRPPGRPPIRPVRAGQTFIHKTPDRPPWAAVTRMHFRGTLSTLPAIERSLDNISQLPEIVLHACRFFSSEDFQDFDASARIDQYLFIPCLTWISQTHVRLPTTGLRPLFLSKGVSQTHARQTHVASRILGPFI